MTFARILRVSAVGSLVVALAGCGAGLDSGFFGARGNSGNKAAQEQAEAAARNDGSREAQRRRRGGTIWDLFQNTDDPNVTVEVNKYIWNASLDVLNFLPIESVDPFSGVIVTGYGTPPGGGRAYRATVYIQDPALDARSLRVALQSRGGGAVSPATQRAIEDAILTRARQLRIRDGKL